MTDQNPPRGDSDSPLPTRGDVAETLRLRSAKTRLTTVKIMSGTVLAALILIFVAGWILTGQKIIITDEMKVFALATLGIAVVSSPYMIAFVNKLWSPAQVFVIRVNVTKRIPVRIKTGSPSLWEDVDVVSGEPYSFAVGNRMCYIVVDLEHIDDIHEDDELADHVPSDVSGWVATGSWLGEASDEEIVRDRTQIEGNRRRNNAWSRYGEVLDAKFEGIARNVERRHHKRLTDHEMDETIFGGGDAIRDEIRKEVPALEDAETDSMHDIIEDEISRQIEAENRPDEVTNR